MSNKFKNILFHIFGIGLFTIGIYISVILAHLILIPDVRDKLEFLIPISIFFFVIWNLITIGFISNLIFDWKKTTFNYVWFIREYLDFKWVYHSGLGYFPISVKPSKIKLYKQGIFSIEKVASIDTDGGVESIANRIKRHLDWLYQDYLSAKKKSEIEKNKKGEIMKWDGYLDTASRRDNKIKEILK